MFKGKGEVPSEKDKSEKAKKEAVEKKDEAAGNAAPVEEPKKDSRMPGDDGFDPEMEKAGKKPAN